MLNKRTAIKKVRAFVKCCRENNIMFNKIILFGSLVNGKVHRYSDIDVALISDQFSGMPISDWQMLSPIKIKSREFIDIEPHPYSTDDFEDGDPFIDVIINSGIEVEV